MLLYGAMLLAGYLEVLGPPAPMFRGPVFAELHRDGEFVIKTYAVVCMAVFVTRHLTSQVAGALDAREREVRARDRALAESRERIDELHARRARFMRTAAHQLKSPLTGIQTLATLIADGEVAGPEAAGVINKIIRRCREAIAQVEELLTLARIREAPSERHGVARTPLLTALNNVVERYRDLAQAKRQQLHCGPIEDGRSDEMESLCVQVDSRDLEVAVGNLTDNAIKYSPEGGTVTVRYGAEGDRAVVRVRDTGPGVAPDNQESIFDEFRRGHHALAARTPGTGLGLAIVREIMEQARGGVSVRSPVNAKDTEHPGAEFQLRLPRCPTGRQSADDGQPPAALQRNGIGR
jgi:signal transduction histidine kinase